MSVFFRILLLAAVGLAVVEFFSYQSRSPAIESPEGVTRELPPPVSAGEPVPPPLLETPAPPAPLELQRGEPPQVPAPSRLEPPVVSRIEPPAVSRVEPPPAPPPMPLPEPALPDPEFYERFAPAVVQIFCTTTDELFSASGVILNANGLLLTNAHVAEFVEKAGEPKCQARHGNPANPFAHIAIVYVASTTARIADTKVPQRDIAFLRITDAREPFTVAPIEGRAIQTGEELLTLGYPSEFLESIAASNNSNLVFSVLRVDGYADIDGDPTDAEGYVFKGGLALQQGSSGTALFTPSGKMAGLMFATTKGATTAEREGIAFTMGYINRVLELETGEGLLAFVASH